MKKTIFAIFAFAIFTGAFCNFIPVSAVDVAGNELIESEEENFIELETDKNFIKWVDFNAKADLMQKIYELDKNSAGKDLHYDFVSILAYITCQNGNKFNTKKDLQILSKLKTKLDAGEKIENIAGKNKYYLYYLDVYTAIFSQYFGWYTVESGEPQYGLKAYCPIASGFGYGESDDFGNSRSYGFKRVHLGHDMFGSIGTPIISVESGIITELGWNRYGGWRIGIRSYDGLRYYYYAHLRKNKPFASGLQKGDKIEAGQVIGYMGVTGYSVKENVNMQGKPHLHFGLQLIFDKSQEDGKGEIWIDVYQLIKFLKNNNRAKVKRQEDGHYISGGLKKEFNPDGNKKNNDGIVNFEDYFNL